MTYNEAVNQIKEMGMPYEAEEASLEAIEEYKPEFDADECTNCAGTGEGQHDGASCQECGGSGVVSEIEEDFDMREAA